MLDHILVISDTWAQQGSIPSLGMSYENEENRL